MSVLWLSLLFPILIRLTSLGTWGTDCLMAPGGVDGEAMHAETVSELCGEEEERGKRRGNSKIWGSTAKKRTPRRRASRCLEEPCFSPHKALLLSIPSGKCIFLHTGFLINQPGAEVLVLSVGTFVEALCGLTGISDYPSLPDRPSPPLYALAPCLQHNFFWLFLWLTFSSAVLTIFSTTLVSDEMSCPFFKKSCLITFA